MGKYTVASGQNLYDVAMHIYGSIEGITDLLINNTSLSMAEGLQPGRELVYTDDYLIDADVAAYNRQRGIVPANGQRNVYHKEPAWPRIAEFRLANSRSGAGFTVSGTGSLEVNWGDNSPLQRIELNDRDAAYSHSFDNSISGQKKIRFYGDLQIRNIDLTCLDPLSFFFYRPLYVETLALRDCAAGLDSLPMTGGLYRIDLRGIRTRNLLPLSECRQLMHIDLGGADISTEALDQYLIALVKHHYGRRNARVILAREPSGQYREPARDDELNYIIGTGMEAIWVLLNEPAWNDGGCWTFDINGKIFTP